MAEAIAIVREREKRVSLGL